MTKQRKKFGKKMGIEREKNVKKKKKKYPRQLGLNLLFPICKMSFHLSMDLQKKREKKWKEEVN